MPADTQFAQRSAGGHVRTDNKVDLRDGDRATATYNATIVAVEYFYADARGRFVKNKAEATQQRCKFAWAIDDSAYVLRDDFPVKFHEKSLYAARCREVAGVRTEDEIAAVDLEKFVGFKGIIDVESTLKTPTDTTKSQYWWTNVKDVRARQRRVSSPPPQRVAAPAEAPQARPAAAEPSRTPAPANVSLDRLLGDLTFPIATSVRKLAEWAKIDDRRLVTLISMISGGSPLQFADVDAVKDKIRAERAA
jgi:hypothetical protein